jgi:hypothetical protein
LGIDKSVYLKLLENSEEVKSDLDGITSVDFAELYRLILNRYPEDEYGNIIPNLHLKDSELFEGEKAEKFIISGPKMDDLRDKCDDSYKLLKRDLGLEGFHHRIDLIPRPDGSSYIINEFENINFGGGPAGGISSWEHDLKTLADLKELQGVNNFEEWLEIISKKYPDIYSIISEMRIEQINNILDTVERITQSYPLDLRQLLLSFSESEPEPEPAPRPALEPEPVAAPRPELLQGPGSVMTEEEIAQSMGTTVEEMRREHEAARDSIRAGGVGAEPAPET